MKRIKNLFTWYLPGSQYDNGIIVCSRQLGGCGKKHEFSIEYDQWDKTYQIEFDLSWEAREGECEKFEFYLEDEAREEWETSVKEEYLKMFEELTKQEEKRGQERLVREGVSIKETQWEKEWGAVRPVGFWKGRKTGIFVCGNCSKEIKGAGKHGKAKNRNNPAFWGLEVREKVLCGECLRRRKGSMSAIRRMKFNQYAKLGIFRGG